MSSESPSIPAPILKAPIVHVSRDVIILNLTDILSSWDFYTFLLDIETTGTKVSTFIILFRSW